MTTSFSAGQAVQTPFGKGVVRELQNSGRLSIDVNGRTLVLDPRVVTPVETGSRSRSKQRTAVPPPSGVAGPRPRGVPAQVDLHGLTVEEALVKVEQVLNDALLADLPEVRLIHGRSGGRVRAAVHNRLRKVSTVRTFCLDPRNPGVTIVSL